MRRVWRWVQWPSSRWARRRWLARCLVACVLLALEVYQIKQARARAAVEHAAFLATRWTGSYVDVSALPAFAEAGPDSADLDSDHHVDLLQRLMRKGWVQRPHRPQRSRRWSSEPEVEDAFTVLINTFRGRDLEAAHLLRSYAQCAGVDRVVLLWNDVGRPVPPVVARAVFAAAGKAMVALQPSRHLSNRFRPQAAVRTKVLFSTDDDVEYRCDLLLSAFAVAKERPLAVVGFAARSLHEKEDYFIYGWMLAFLEGRYNAVWVTKGGFAHRELHERYFDNDEFAEVRAAVDDLVTGEDMLFAFTQAFFFLGDDDTAHPLAGRANHAVAVFTPRGAYWELVSSDPVKKKELELKEMEKKHRHQKRHLRGEAAVREKEEEEEEEEVEEEEEESTSLVLTTSQHRPHIAGMIREVLSTHHKADLLRNMYTYDWCQPFSTPPVCNCKGTPALFAKLYPPEAWFRFPDSKAPYVQV